MTTGTGGSGDTRKVQLEVTVDATGAKTGTEAVKTAVRDMASVAATEGQKAATSVAAIGGGADQSAQKLDRATKSMVSQIQRAKAEIETIGSGGTRADYFERLAKSRGLDQQAIGPYLQQLREIEKAQRATAGSMDATGMSAKQMSFAMRGLPAQFTDIAVGLASGQRPMMVLIQQGGQIKDMFGGVIPAIRAMATAVMGMINPFTLAAAAIGGLAFAYDRGASEAQRMRDAMIASGNAAGVTDARLQATAARMDALGTTRGKAAEALEAFVRTGRVGAEELERFSLAAVKFEAVGGQAVDKTAEAFADLARDPLRAVTRLNEAMNFLDAATLNQITTLERAGRTTEAARVAQDAYAKALEDRAPQMLQNLGLIERTWAGIKTATKESVDALLSIGRQKSLLEEVATLQGRLNNPANFPMGASERSAAEQQLRALQEQLRVKENAARFDAIVASQQAAQVRATETWNRRSEEFLTKQQRLALELSRIEAEGLAAGKTRAEIDERLAAARAKYAEKVKEAAGFEQEQGRAYRQFVEDFIKDSQKAQAAAADLTSGQSKLLAMISDPVWQTMPEAWKQQALQIAYAAIKQEQLNEATKEYEKLLRQVQAGIDKASDAYGRETQRITEKTAKMRLETAQLGLTKDAQAQLAIAINDTEVARLEALRNTDLYALASEREQADIDARIAALKELSEAMRQAGQAGALQDLRQDWNRFASQIEQSLTDALVRGFEGGRGIFKSVGDWIVNYFKTVVARGIAQAVMAAGASALSSVANAASSSGGGGGSMFGGGGGGGSDILGNLGSIASMFGGGASIFGAGGAGGAFLGGLGASLGTGSSMFGGFSAAGSLMSTGTLGGAAAGGMMALGAAVPYIAAAYALYRIISGVGTGRARGPAYQEWATSGPMNEIFAGGVSNPGGGSWQGGHYQPQVNAIVDAVSAAARSLGGTLNTGTTFGLYSAQSPDGLGANTLSAVVGASGNPLYWMNRTGGNADVAQLFADTFPAMILAGLRDANLPKHISEFLNEATITDQASLDAVIAAAAATHQMAEAFKQLGGPFEQLADLSVQARAGILDLTGGLESFLQKSSSYLQNFYSDEERQALSLASVNRTLTGVGLDTSGLNTTADFRRLVESLDLSTEAGQRQFAALMNSADAFSFGADLLGSTGMNLAQLTASAPSTVGVDLMVSAQVTTNGLLERIESAILQSGAQTVAAIGSISAAAGGGSVSEIANVYDGTTGGGN